MTTPDQSAVPSAAETTRRVFALAAALLSEPGSWIQHEVARDGDGDVTSPFAAEAKCFCLIGAVERAKRDLKTDAPVLYHLRQLVPPNTLLSKWNDAPHRRREEVVDLLMKAAQEC